MPVSAADDFDEPPAKCCKYCDDDSAEREVWNIQIDSDILDTIKDKFPAWFSPVATTSKHTPFEAFGDFPSLIAMAHHGLPSLSELNDDVLSSGSGSSESRQSPPKAIVDSSPLAMDKNRESLKVKLMVRRSVNQLVEQGIMPPLKTSPAIHEQKKLLERAKTGDLLKAKIQQRPDRQELERRHILETHESHIDPSLADKYRMLEKAILVDQLNSKISHRPGPLELIEKNILHADEPIERIVKNGLVTFKTTLEDEEIAASSNFVPLEDDSTQSSEGDAQVQHQHVQILQQVQPVHKVPQIHHQVIKTEPDEQMYHHIVNANMLEAAATSAGIINIQVALPTHEIREIQAPIINFFQNLQNQQNQINLQNAQQSVQNVQIVPPPPPLPIKTETITYHVKQISQPILQSHQIPKVEPQKSSFIPVMEPKHRIDQNMQQNVHSPGSVSSSMSPASSIASPGPILPNKNSIASFLQSNQKYSAPGKDKNRKKSKSKPMSKLRAIKFHEYKGPPNSKGGSSSGSNGNSSKKTGETNYELILQQQCLLEYLEGIYKPPHQIQPKMKVEMGEEPVQQHQHTMKFHDSSALTEKHNLVMNRPPASNTLQKAQVTIFPSPAVSSSTNISNNIVAAPVVTTTITDIAKLNKMKVSDLKAQLKKLNLPVSGPKPLLVERLKPFLPFETATAPSSVASTTSAMAPSTVNIEEETISSNNSHNSNISHELDHFNSSLHSQQSQHSVSSESDVDFMEVQNSPAPPTHYMQMPSNLSNISNISSVSNISNISNISVTEEDIVREQQRKIEELQRQLQQSQLELEQMKQHQLPESEHGSPTNMQDIEGDEEPEPLQFAQIDVKAENQAIYSPTPANFLPPKETKNFLIFENNQFNNINNRSNLNSQTPMFLVQEEKPEPSISNNVGIISPPTMVEKAPSQSPKLLRIENPPMYKLAAKEKKLMMSHEIQDMNDVLEILIKNGELDERIIESRTPNYAHLMIDPNVMFDSSSSPLIEPPDTSLLAFSDDYSILSPMQPMQEDHHIDHIDHNGETIDKLLGQAQNNIPLNSMHLPSITAKYQPMLQESVREPPSHNLTDFTDIDYMEFPMEIEEPQKEGHCDSSSNSLNNCYGENDLLDRFANTGKNPSMHRSVDENHQQLILNSFIECLSNNNNPICAGNPYLTSNIYGQKSMLGKEQLLVNDPSNITPMDFDNILSFDLQANDSFDSHNDSYMNNNLLNDDYRMNNGDTIMNCEVDNLLCNI